MLTPTLFRSQVHISPFRHNTYKSGGFHQIDPLNIDFCTIFVGLDSDHRRSPIEIYKWDGEKFMDAPEGAPMTFGDPGWANFQGNWGDNRDSSKSIASGMLSINGPTGLYNRDVNLAPHATFQDP